MNDLTTAELLEKAAREAERLRIYVLSTECKTLEELQAKLKTLIDGK